MKHTLRAKAVKNAYDTDRVALLEKIVANNACREMNAGATNDMVTRASIVLAVVGILAVAGSIAVLSRL